MTIAVFCSGNGSNFQAIVDAAKKGLFDAKVALMVCDNPQAHAIKRAEKEGIKALIIERTYFPSKQEFEARIIQGLEEEKIELIALAGYMRILSPEFVARYRNRILNIHPAILPSFKGTQGIREALDYGVKVTGVTVHIVNEDMDAGPIILQEAVEIKPEDTEESLAERVHRVEHRLYPEAIRLFTKGRLKIMGRKVKILTGVAIIFLTCGFESKAMLGREVFSPMLSQRETMVCRGTLPSLPIKENALSLMAEDKLSAEDKPSIGKNLRLNSVVYDRLGLTTPLLYDIDDNTDSDYSGKLLNTDQESKRPLTREEIEKMKIEGSIRIARAFAEAANSMNAEFAYQGINSIIDTAIKVIDLREYLANKYNLHFKVEKDLTLLRYKRRF